MMITLLPDLTLKRSMQHIVSGMVHSTFRVKNWPITRIQSGEIEGFKAWIQSRHSPVGELANRKK